MGLINKEIFAYGCPAVACSDWVDVGRLSYVIWISPGEISRLKIWNDSGKEILKGQSVTRRATITAARPRLRSCFRPRGPTLVLSEKRDLGAETRGGSAIPAEKGNSNAHPLWQNNVSASFGAVAFLREHFSWMTILRLQPRLRESDIGTEGR